MKIYIPHSAEIVELKDFSSKHISIIDIANSLSKQCRYNGNIPKFYSVAEHCVLLVEYMQRELKNSSIGRSQKGEADLLLQILLHDAAEAYIGDVIYHVKRSLPDFSALDKTLTSIILNHFMCNNPEHYDNIHILDRRICIDEMRAMCGIIDPDLNSYLPLGVHIKNWNPDEAKAKFLETFITLTNMRNT